MITFNKPEFYQKISTIDSETFQSLKTKIINLDNTLWLNEEQRKIAVPTQSHTDTITICNKEVIDHEVEIYRKTFVNESIFNYLNPELDKILNEIKNFYGSGEPKRIILARLNAGKSILLHCDTGAYMNAYNRIHLPIITNYNVDFYVEGHLVPMEETMLIEINNLTFHRVDNKSRKDRIHMIVDWGHQDTIVNYTNIRP